MLSGASEFMGRLRRACTVITSMTRSIMGTCPGVGPHAFMAVVSRSVRDHAGACAARCALSSATIDDWSAYACSFVPLSLEDWWASWLLEAAVHGPRPGSTIWLALGACTGFLDRYAALVRALSAQDDATGVHAVSRGR